VYIWGKQDWPTLTWDNDALTRLLAQVSREQGRLLGKMEGLGFELRDEAHLQTLTEDVVKSSEIEGEALERDQVRSSIARRLGICDNEYNHTASISSRAFGESRYSV
jgi:Fic family protein